MGHFDKLNQSRVRDALNVLLEAPFFYRDDDEDLFRFLRKNRLEFERFFTELFGWELLVGVRMARVFKQRWHNRALRPSQHDVFEPTTRNECIAFLLVLEFHEHLREEQNLAPDDAELPRFYFGQLFEFACRRMAEELGEGAPDETDIRKLLRGLVPTLLRFRFLRELEPPRDDPGIDRDNLIYECLPGLYGYDPRQLGPRALASFVAGELPAPAPGSGAEVTA